MNRTPGLVFAVVLVVPLTARAQEGHAVIIITRSTCFGACPAYRLEVRSTGRVAFKLDTGDKVEHELRTNRS